MTHFLVYWTTEQIEQALEEGDLPHAGGAQLKKAVQGDRLWIVGRAAKHSPELFVIGYLDVDQRLGKKAAQAEMERRFPGYTVYDSPWHVLAAQGQEIRTRAVSLAPLYKSLQFESSRSPTLKIKTGHPNAQQLQSVRQLVPQSSQSILTLWRGGRAANGTPRASQSPARLRSASTRKLEDELTEAMRSAYRRAGEEVGYWGRRFIQSVNRNGGLPTAKRMLLPRNSSQRAGLDRLLEADRADLTLEAIVLRPRFRSLFSTEEIQAARERLGRYRKAAKALPKERLFPDELPKGKKYIQGAKREVRVNAYERDREARGDCIDFHGTSCAVCSFSFGEVYGEIGNGFIHVHHLKPVSQLPVGYVIDPKKHLAPVCPNCHAMLHRREPPLTINALRAKLAR